MPDDRRRARGVRQQRGEVVRRGRRSRHGRHDRRGGETCLDRRHASERGCCGCGAHVDRPFGRSESVSPALVVRARVVPARLVASSSRSICSCRAISRRCSARAAFVETFHGAQCDHGCLPVVLAPPAQVRGVRLGDLAGDERVEHPALAVPTTGVGERGGVLDRSGRAPRRTGCGASRWRRARRPRRVVPWPARRGSAPPGAVARAARAAVGTGSRASGGPHRGRRRGRRVRRATRRAAARPRRVRRARPCPGAGTRRCRGRSDRTRSTSSVGARHVGADVDQVLDVAVGGEQAAEIRGRGAAARRS